MHAYCNTSVSSFIACTATSYSLSSVMETMRSCKKRDSLEQVAYNPWKTSSNKPEYMNLYKTSGRYRNFVTVVPCIFTKFSNNSTITL